MKKKENIFFLTMTLKTVLYNFKGNCSLLSNTNIVNTQNVV